MKKLRVLGAILLLVVVSGCFGPKNDVEGYKAWTTEMGEKRTALTYADATKVKKEEKKYKENLDAYLKVIEKGNEIEMQDEIKEKHMDSVYKTLLDDHKNFEKLYQNRNLKTNKEVTNYNLNANIINANRYTIPAKINDVIKDMEK